MQFVLHLPLQLTKLDDVLFAHMGGGGTRLSQTLTRYTLAWLSCSHASVAIDDSPIRTLFKMPVAVRPPRGSAEPAAGDGVEVEVGHDAADDEPRPGETCVVVLALDGETLEQMLAAVIEAGSGDEDGSDEEEYEYDDADGGCGSEARADSDSGDGGPSAEDSSAMGNIEAYYIHPVTRLVKDDTNKLLSMTTAIEEQITNSTEIETARTSLLPQYVFNSEGMATGHACTPQYGDLSLILDARVDDDGAADIAVLFVHWQNVNKLSGRRVRLDRFNRAIWNVPYAVVLEQFW